MNINVSPVDFMTDKQKEEIANACHKKIMDAIKSVKIQSSSISMAKYIKDDLDAFVADEGFVNYEMASDIGNAITKHMIENVNNLFKDKK